MVIFCHEDYSNSYLMSWRMLEYNRLDEYTKIWRSRRFCLKTIEIELNKSIIQLNLFLVLVFWNNCLFTFFPAIHNLCFVSRMNGKKIKDYDLSSTLYPLDWLANTYENSLKIKRRQTSIRSKESWRLYQTHERSRLKCRRRIVEY